jgi:hypothetical protein
VPSDKVDDYQAQAQGKIMISRADLDSWLAGHRHDVVDLEALADQALKELAEKP